MPEAQALIAIVLDPQKGCQPHGADNLFIYSYDFRSQRFSLPFDPSTSSGQAGSGRTAAWYFIVIVYRFFAPQGEKTIHKEMYVLSE